MHSRLEQEFEEYAYRVYISDSLKHVFNLNRRFYDIIEMSKEPEEDGDEVAARIITQAGLRFEE